MADFEITMKTVMDNEDRARTGKVIVDEGGATKFGISLHFLQKHSLTEADLNHDGKVDDQDIYALTLENAYAFYREYFWNPICGDEIASQQVATKLMDMTVNMGLAEATKLCQRACRLPEAQIDNVFGPITLAALNALSEADALKGLRQWSVWLYETIAKNRPVTPNEYASWMRRAVA